MGQGTCARRRGAPCCLEVARPARTAVGLVLLSFSNPDRRLAHVALAPLLSPPKAAAADAAIAFATTTVRVLLRLLPRSSHAYNLFRHRTRQKRGSRRAEFPCEVTARHLPSPLAARRRSPLWSRRRSARRLRSYGAPRRRPRRRSGAQGPRSRCVGRPAARSIAKSVCFAQHGMEPSQSLHSSAIHGHVLILARSQQDVGGILSSWTGALWSRIEDSTNAAVAEASRGPECLAAPGCSILSCSHCLAILRAVSSRSTAARRN